MAHVRRLWPLVLLLAWPAAGTAQTTDCSTLGQTTFVRNTMRDIYYWYQQLPDPDPALFDSPEAYLEAVRYKELDSTFSYISVESTSDAFFSDSQYVGFGFRQTLVADDDLRVVEAFPGSPAAVAGLDRNQQVLAIDGRSVPDLLAAGALDAALGPAQQGVTVTVRLRDPDGHEHDATMVKGLVTIPTVAAARTFDVDGHKVGYVLFHNFVTPSNAALDEAFAQLVRDGAQDLVLDLRYNGGGLVSVAQHLSSLIGGMRTNGQLLARYAHNDKNSFRNTSIFFDAPAAELSAPRLVAITTHASASASELVINALKPYITVTTVGSDSYGKPVGQYGYRFCGKILFPVAFSLRNAADQGDYFGGFAPTCAAPDDLSHPLGDPGEASLGEALHYAATGECTGRAAQARASARRLPLQPYEVAGNGFRRLVGAY